MSSLNPGNSFVQVLTQPMPGTWRRVLQPQLSETDFPYLYGAWNVSDPADDADALLRANVVAEPNAEVVKLRTLFVPHYPQASFRGSLPGGLAYPALTWTHYATTFGGGSGSFTSAGTYGGIGSVWTFPTSDNPAKTYLHFYDPLDPYSARMLWTDRAQKDTGLPKRDAYVSDATGWQGFRFLYKLQATPFDASGHTWGETRASFSLGIGDPSGTLLWVQVTLTPGKEPEIRQTRATLSQFSGYQRTGSPALHFEAIKAVQIPAGYWQSVAADEPYAEEPLPQKSLRAIEMELVAGKLFLRFDGVDNPAIVPLPLTNNVPPLLCNAAWVHYENFTEFNFHGAPLKYLASGQWESADHQLGFVPTGTPTYRAETGVPLIAGTSVSVDNVDSTTARYTMTLTGSTPEGTIPGTGDAYCAYSPTLRAVTYAYPLITSFLPAPPSVLYPESVTVAHRFDYNRLQITSEASLRFNNNAGGWGAWNQQHGQVALAINAGTSYRAMSRQLTGIGHRTGTVFSTEQGGESKFDLSVSDRSVQLQQPRWALPWFDGWNVYYGMAFLAELGGIAPQDMGFQAFIPPDPYTDIGNPDGVETWFLPVGSAGTALTRFSGVNLWDIMSKIAFTIGFLLYFDAQGILQFKKFQIPSGFKRLFYEQDTFGFDACWQLQVTRSLEDVRNTVSVIGIDAFAPLWSPILAHRQDAASISDPSAANFIGYEQPLVWADSQFANAAFASAAADALFAFLRQPSEIVHLTTWLQPDLYPLDVIGIASDRWGTTGKRYLILEVHHSYFDGALGTTRLLARNAPEGGL